MSAETSSIAALFSYFDSNREQLLEDLFTFLRFQSISTDPEHKSDVRACADWLSDYLNNRGISATIWETPGHPTVFAEWNGAGADKPTILIYGHYDVQPVDPVELWHSPPFEPVIKDGEIFARGAVDNKGQCFFFIHALLALLDRDKALPVNVKLVIEGEEEVGSSGLEEILSSRKSELAADYLLVVDSGIEHLDRPSVTIGYRGITAMTVTLRGSSTDLHSGIHGGIVINPLHTLVKLLAELRDDQGRIAVPGFYDEVKQLSEKERAAVDFHFDAEEYRREFGALPAGGEKDYTPLESAWLRPTLEINGIRGGYAGEGFKTVIPAEAVAKLSCRLVPEQKPDAVCKQIEEFLRARTPEGMELEVSFGHGGKALWASPESKLAQVSKAAISEVTEKECRFIYTGGTIPITAALADAAKAEVTLIGYCLPTDNLHAPNEHFGVERVRLGIATVARILERLARD